jgi:hypothetical protein
VRVKMPRENKILTPIRDVCLPSTHDSHYNDRTLLATCTAEAVV